MTVAASLLAGLWTELQRPLDRSQTIFGNRPTAGDHVVEERLAAGRPRVVLPHQERLRRGCRLQDDRGARARRSVAVCRLRNVTANPEQAIDGPRALEI